MKITSTNVIKRADDLINCISKDAKIKVGPVKIAGDSDYGVSNNPNDDIRIISLRSAEGRGSVATFLCCLVEHLGGEIIWDHEKITDVN